MHVSIEHGDDEVVVSLRGELDADTCQGLGPRLLAAAVGVPTLVIELSELTFIDSSGISELLRVRETVDERGQRFAVRNPSTTVRRVLEITGLGAHLGLT